MWCFGFAALALASVGGVGTRSRTSSSSTRWGEVRWGEHRGTVSGACDKRRWEESKEKESRGEERRGEERTTSLSASRRLVDSNARDISTNQITPAAPPFIIILLVFPLLPSPLDDILAWQWQKKGTLQGLHTSASNVLATIPLWRSPLLHLGITDSWTPLFLDKIRRCHLRGVPQRHKILTTEPISRVLKSRALVWRWNCIIYPVLSERESRSLFLPKSDEDHPDVFDG